MWQTLGSRTDQQVCRGQEGLSEVPSIPQKASQPREARLERGGNELGWQGGRRWHKRGGVVGRAVRQAQPKTLDSDSSYLDNSTDYLGILLSWAKYLVNLTHRSCSDQSDH